MKNINIAQALKEKNRIAGRIHKLQKQVAYNNLNDGDKEADFNSLELLKELQTEWAYLIELKTRLAKANVGICDRLVRLAEAKSELMFWLGFSNAGPAVESYSCRHHDGVAIVTEVKTRRSTITSKEILEHQERVQQMIEDLQDEIDIYNGTTQI